MRMRTLSRWPAVHAVAFTVVRNAVYTISERLHPSLTKLPSLDAPLERVCEDEEMWSDEVARRIWANPSQADD
jgi:hypothetical protein